MQDTEELRTTSIIKRYVHIIIHGDSLTIFKLLELLDLYI